MATNRWHTLLQSNNDNIKFYFCCRPDGDNQSALLCLRKGRKLKDIFSMARSIDTGNIVTFNQMRSEVQAEIEQTEIMAGTKVNSTMMPW